MAYHVLGMTTVAHKYTGMLGHALAMLAVDLFRPLGMLDALVERVPLVDQSTLRTVSAIV
jgi:hypothetical protein